MINNGIQIGSNNPAAGSGLDETAVNALITNHDENVSAHQDIRDQQTALSSQISGLGSALGDKADKATTYTKTEVDGLVSSAGGSPAGSIEIYENFARGTANFETESTFNTIKSETNAYSYLNSSSMEANITAGQSYFGVDTFYALGTLNAESRLNTFVPERYIKLNTLSSFEIENRVCLLQSDGSKSQHVRWGLTTGSSLSESSSNNYVSIKYNQITGELYLLSRLFGNTSTVILKILTDNEAKAFNKIKITYDGTTIKGYFNGVLCGSITINIPVDSNMIYIPYQITCVVSGVSSRSFLDYFYAKFKFNN